LTVEDRPGLMFMPGNSTVLGCVIHGSQKLKIRPTLMRWMKDGRELRGNEEEKYVGLEVSLRVPTVTTKKYSANYTETDDRSESTLLVNGIGTGYMGT